MTMTAIEKAMRHGAALERKAIRAWLARVDYEDGRLMESDLRSYLAKRDAAAGGKPGGLPGRKAK